MELRDEWEESQRVDHGRCEGNVARDGIRGMKEWQGEKVEEVGEEERRDQCEWVQREKTEGG